MRPPTPAAPFVRFLVLVAASSACVGSVTDADAPANATSLSAAESVGGSSTPTIAFEANTTALWTTSGQVGAGQDLEFGMMSGTSPSVATLPSGGYVVAFQSNVGQLWTYVGGAGGGTNLEFGMMRGTSPSVAVLTSGQYVVAFQSNVGQLWTYVGGASGGTNLGFGLMPGTSPSIAPLATGGYVVAFQSNVGQLWTYVGGAGGGTNLEFGMKAGTSPSVAPLGSGYVVAFQANTGSLWTYVGGASGGTNLSLGMLGGTSPSIAPLATGGYVVAFQANTGSLWTYVSGNGYGSNLALGMRSGTSPAVVALPSGGYEVAFQANTSALWTYTSGAGGGINLGLGMATGTSPALAPPLIGCGPFAPGGLALQEGQSAFCNGVQLFMQADGNLVAYQGGAALWATNTSGVNCSDCFAIFQGDGNLVLYDGASAYWASNTADGEISPNVATQLVLSAQAPYVTLPNAAGGLAWAGFSSDGADFTSVLTFDHAPAVTPFGISEWTLSEDQGRDMDVMSIEQESENQLVAVYHNGISDNQFCLRLATASLLTQSPWHYVTDIDCDYGSQGSIKRLPDGAYLVAYEKNSPNGTHPFIQFLYYPSYAALLGNAATRNFAAPFDPSSNSEGTPNFRYIQYDGDPDTISIQVGFHYNAKSTGRDMNAIGQMTGFQSWSWSPNTPLNDLVEQVSSGNIGGRAFFVSQGVPYTLVETMTVAGDWSSWRLFLYNEAAGTLTAIPVATPQGGLSFGNPKLSYVLEGNELMIVGTTFSFNTPYGANHFYSRTVASGPGLSRPEFQVTGP